MKTVLGAGMVLFVLVILAIFGSALAAFIEVVNSDIYTLIMGIIGLSTFLVLSFIVGHTVLDGA